VLCILVIAVCAVNPREGASIEELTHHASAEPVSTGIGDLGFTYPGGLASEQREVDNWSHEDRLRSLRRLPTRRRYNHFFLEDGIDFGGVVDFILPRDRVIRLEEMNLPTAWEGLDYIAGSSSYPFAEQEYTLIRDGKDHIQLYLYTYSGRGYFIWFYMDRGTPAHKEAILESVEIGSGGRIATKLKSDEELSLGLFNITIPGGYGYSRREAAILEITKKDPFRGQEVIGCVTARSNPHLPTESSEDLKRWVEAVGVALSSGETGYTFQITDRGAYADITLYREETVDGKQVMAENHYFFIAGDIVYDLWFDGRIMDREAQEDFLESIWIKEAGAWSSGFLPGTPAITRTGKEEAFMLCKSLLNMVQSGGHQIASEYRFEGGRALNRSSEALYTAQGTDWMSITHIVDDDSYWGFLHAGEEYYSNEGRGWEADWSPNWQPDPHPDEVHAPWLASYQWDEAHISYIDTLQETGSLTVMLRIDAPFPGYEDLAQCYFVNLHFSSSGAFQHADIRLAYAWENNTSYVDIKETIRTLDPETVREAIEKELLRAVS